MLGVACRIKGCTVISTSATTRRKTEFTDSDKGRTVSHTCTHSVDHARWLLGIFLVVVSAKLEVGGLAFQFQDDSVTKLRRDSAEHCSSIHNRVQMYGAIHSELCNCVVLICIKIFDSMQVCIY
jgi:hypothetical protein